MQHRVWDKPCDSAVEHYWKCLLSHTHFVSLSRLFSSSKEVNYILPKSIIIFLLCPALTGPLIDSWKPLRWNPCMCLNRSLLLLQCARDNQFVCIRPRKCQYLSKAHANISFPGHVLIWKLRSWDDRTQRPWRKRESWGEREIHYLSLFMRQYGSLRETKTHSPSPCSTSPHSALID